MTDKDTLELARQELNTLLMVLQRQGLSNTEIIELLLDGYRELGGSVAQVSSISVMRKQERANQCPP